MPNIIDKRKTLSDLMSPHRDMQRPIYNWHSFKHSYSKALVDWLVKEFRLKRGEWVMDPFCGGGTTLLACKEFGINADGFDILPFSVFLSNVKIRNYDPTRLQAEQRRFNQRKRRLSMHIPSLTKIPIAKKAFSNGVRNELIQIKQTIQEIHDSTVRDFYNLALLSILEGVSNTSKSGGFLRITKRRIRSGAAELAFKDRVESMITGARGFNESMQWNGVQVSASHGDAREVGAERTYDAVITSPPYPNRHDYTRIYALEMLFDFVQSNDDLKRMRYDTLRSHVEARKKFECKGYVIPTLLTRVIERVKRSGTNNPMITTMITGYFEDMYLALNEMSKRLRGGGKIALVVSTVRFAGVNIPVDELLCDIGKQVGLKSKGLWLARYRGNSSQQMGEYGRKASRESIVVWEK